MKWKVAWTTVALGSFGSLRRRRRATGFFGVLTVPAVGESNESTPPHHSVAEKVDFNVQLRLYGVCVYKRSERTSERAREKHITVIRSSA